MRTKKQVKHRIAVKRSVKEKKRRAKYLNKVKAGTYLRKYTVAPRYIRERRNILSDRILSAVPAEQSPKKKSVIEKAKAIFRPTTNQ